MRPLHSRTRGIAPGPVLRCRSLLFHSSFRMLLGETKQGPMRPPYPGSRAISPAPFLRWKKHIVHTSFRMKLKITEREPTGAMKMKKKAGQESLLSCRFFLIFPGCKASGRRCFTPPSPWAGACGASSSQRNNLPLQRGFCVAAVPQPIRKYTIFICESMCACCSVSPEHCLCYMNCCFRKKGQGATPLVGCGVKPRIVSPRNTGKLYERYSLLLPEKGCRVNDPAGPAGVWGKAPP